MLLKITDRGQKTLMMLGMLFLVVANFAARFLPRLTHLSPDAVDGAQGFFIGMAIGLLLLSMWIGRHRHQNGATR